MTLEDKKKEIAKLFLAGVNWRASAGGFYKNNVYIKLPNQDAWLRDVCESFEATINPGIFSKKQLVICHVSEWRKGTTELIRQDITKEEYDIVKISAKNKVKNDQDKRTAEQQAEYERLINILYEGIKK